MSNLKKNENSEEKQVKKKHFVEEKILILPAYEHIYSLLGLHIEKDDESFEPKEFIRLVDFFHIYQADMVKKSYAKDLNVTCSSRYIQFPPVKVHDEAKGNLLFETLSKSSSITKYIPLQGYNNNYLNFIVDNINTMDRIKDDNIKYTIYDKNDKNRVILNEYPIIDRDNFSPFFTIRSDENIIEELQKNKFRDSGYGLALHNIAGLGYRALVLNSYFIAYRTMYKDRKLNGKTEEPRWSKIYPTNLYDINLQENLANLNRTLAKELYTESYKLQQYLVTSSYNISLQKADELNKENSKNKEVTFPWLAKSNYHYLLNSHVSKHFHMNYALVLKTVYDTYNYFAMTHSNNTLKNENTFLEIAEIFIIPEIMTYLANIVKGQKSEIKFPYESRLLKYDKNEGFEYIGSSYKYRTEYIKQLLDEENEDIFISKLKQCLDYILELEYMYKMNRELNQSLENKDMRIKKYNPEEKIFGEYKDGWFTKVISDIDSKNKSSKEITINPEIRGQMVIVEEDTEQASFNLGKSDDDLKKEYKRISEFIEKYRGFSGFFIVEFKDLFNNNNLANHLFSNKAYKVKDIPVKNLAIPFFLLQHMLSENILLNINIKLTVFFTDSYIINLDNSVFIEKSDEDIRIFDKKALSTLSDLTNFPLSPFISLYERGYELFYMDSIYRLLKMFFEKEGINFNSYTFVANHNSKEMIAFCSEETHKNYKDRVDKILDKLKCWHLDSLAFRALPLSKDKKGGIKFTSSSDMVRVNNGDWMIKAEKAAENIERLEEDLNKCLNTFLQNYIKATDFPFE